MVQVNKGILIECDEVMKQFLLNLDEKKILGRKFILQDLDERHIFVSPDILETLQSKIDDLIDQSASNIVERS